MNSQGTRPNESTSPNQTYFQISQENTMNDSHTIDIESQSNNNSAANYSQNSIEDQENDEEDNLSNEEHPFQAEDEGESMTFTEKIQKMSKTCCTNCLSYLANNKFVTFMLFQMFIVILKILKLFDDEILFWATLVPCLLILFSIVTYMCYKAFTPDLTQSSRANRSGQDLNDILNQRMMNQLITNHLRQRLQQAMAANQQAQQMYEENRQSNPELEEPGFINDRGQRVNPRDFIREMFQDIGIIINPELLEMQQRAMQRGLSQEQIDSMPVEKYLIPLKGLVEPEACSICIDEFQQEQNLKKLPCSHRFHVKCIDDWLKIQNNCPNCKTEIPRNE